jgi:hypothetical protein
LRSSWAPRAFFPIEGAWHQRMPSNLRTVIDVPDEMVEMLDRVGGLEKRPRAALIREAIGEFLGGNPFRRR